MNLNKQMNVYKVKTNKTISPSKMFQHLRGIAAVLVLLALAACGSNVAPPVTAIIGAPSRGQVGRRW
jgi:hypothetical protein